MAYLFILLSSACSLILAHLLKTAERKQLRTVNTLTVNYLTASAAAFITGWIETTGAGYEVDFGRVLLLFCIVAGILFIGNYTTYSKSVHLNGVGISIAAMRLSLLIPVLVSVYAYNEVLSPLQSAGVVLVFGALFLLVPRENGIKTGGTDAGWLLIIVFILTGLADASLKIYEEEFGPRLSELLFMSMVFAGAFATGVAICLFRRTHGSLFTRDELKLGAWIGIPNLFSSVFLLYALNGLNGALVFSLVNILNVLGGTALGLFWWRDRIASRQWWGIAVAVVAIVMLLM